MDNSSTFALSPHFGLVLLTISVINTMIRRVQFPTLETDVNYELHATCEILLSFNYVISEI